jgi:hypothetical protein
MMPHDSLEPDQHRHRGGVQVPHLHHDLCVDPPTPAGQGRAMTAQFNKTTDEEFEVQLRNLVRFVSACTLGLWSFSVGLLIGTFYLF